MTIWQKTLSVFGGNHGLKQTIFKNTFWLIIGQMASKLIKFILIIYAARILGANGYGSFSYALSFTSLTFMFSDLGIASLLVREYNKVGINKSTLITNTFYIKIALLIISIAITAVLSILIQDPITKSVLIFIMFMYVINGIRDILIGIVRAKERMELESIIIFTESMLTSLLGIWFLFNFSSALTLGIAYGVGAVGSLILALLFTFKSIPTIFIKPNWIYIKNILSSAWPFAFGFVVAAILTSTDSVMLGAIKGPTVVGHYSVGVRIIQILLTIPAFLSVALLPSLSKFIQDKARIIVLVRKAVDYVMMLGWPLLIGGIILANRLIPRLFGIEYQPGILSFQILSILIIILSSVIVFDYTLLAFNLQFKNFQYTAIAAISNIIFNLLLIPFYGLYGAAIATVLAQTINFILTTKFINNILNYNVLQIKNMLKFIVASILMGLTIQWIMHFHISLWFIIAIAALIYFLLLYVLREKNLKEILGIFNA